MCLDSDCNKKKLNNFGVFCYDTRRANSTKQTFTRDKQVVYMFTEMETLRGRRLREGQGEFVCVCV